MSIDATENVFVGIGVLKGFLDTRVRRLGCVGSAGEGTVVFAVNRKCPKVLWDTINVE